MVSVVHISFNNIASRSGEMSNAIKEKVTLWAMSSARRNVVLGLCVFIEKIRKLSISSYKLMNRFYFRDALVAMNKKMYYQVSFLQSRSAGKHR